MAEVHLLDLNGESIDPVYWTSDSVFDFINKKRMHKLSRQSEIYLKMQLVSYNFFTGVHN